MHSQTPIGPRIVTASTRSVPLPLLDVFDSVAIVNASSDKNRERVTNQFRALGFGRIPDIVKFFPEIPLTRPHGWASLSASTAFMTLYSVLKQALDSGLNSILLWDSSADFGQRFAPHQSEVFRGLKTTTWDLLLLGFEDAGFASKAQPHIPKIEAQVILRASSSLRGVSAFAINRSLLPHLVKSMEQVLDNPTSLLSPFYPTASSSEPEAISIVLSMLLRSKPELLALVPRALAPVSAFEKAGHRSSVIEIFRTKAAGG
jgi:hypothetical protein